MATNDILSHLFTTFAHLLHGPIITRLNKIHISTRKPSLSEVNISPIWRNTLGHILLCTVDDYPVRFTMLINHISSNLRPQMMVLFYWFLYIYKKISREGEKKITGIN